MVLVTPVTPVIPVALAVAEGEEVALVVLFPQILTTDTPVGPAVLGVCPVAMAVLAVR